MSKPHQSSSIWVYCLFLFYMLLIQLFLIPNLQNSSCAPRVISIACTWLKPSFIKYLRSTYGVLFSCYNNHGFTLIFTDLQPNSSVLMIHMAIFLYYCIFLYFHPQIITVSVTNIVFFFTLFNLWKNSFHSHIKKDGIQHITLLQMMLQIKTIPDSSA